MVCIVDGAALDKPPTHLLTAAPECPMMQPMGVSLAARSTCLQPLDASLPTDGEFDEKKETLIADQSVHPVVGEVIALDEADAAHRCVEKNAPAGKTVLRVASSFSRWTSHQTAGCGPKARHINNG